MLNKVAVLCVDPWEKFWPPAFQTHSKNYYQWIKNMAAQKNIKIYCKEYIDTYGISNDRKENNLFLEDCEDFQLLYVQSDRQEILENIFRIADLVIMGLPGSRKQFDKIFMSVCPWKDEIMFLWGNHISRDQQYVDKLIRECALRKEQLIEIGKECRRNSVCEKAPALSGSL